MNKELRAVCGDCRHSWVVAYLPMEVAKLARIARGSFCPQCASSRVFLKSPGRPSDDLKLPRGGSSEMSQHGGSPSPLYFSGERVPPPRKK